MVDPRRILLIALSVVLVVASGRSLLAEPPAVPAVEAGARDATAKGPLGFPVVDIHVTLTDGQHHSVDSSDFAFRTAGRSAVNAALAEAGTIVPLKSTEIDPGSSPKQVPAMTTSSPGTAEALADIDRPECVPILASILSDNEPTVRAAAWTSTARHVSLKCRERPTAADGRARNPPRFGGCRARGCPRG